MVRFGKNQHFSKLCFQLIKVSTRQLTQGLTSKTTILFSLIICVIDLNLSPYKFPLYSPCSKYSLFFIPLSIASRDIKLYLSMTSGDFVLDVSAFGRLNRDGSLKVFFYESYILRAYRFNKPFEKWITTNTNCSDKN